MRRASRHFGLRTWDKPAAACLASRIPYGTAVTVGLLGRIDRAEAALHRLGLRQVRVRHYGDTARLEVELADIAHGARPARGGRGRRAIRRLPVRHARPRGVPERQPQRLTHRLPSSTVEGLPRLFRDRVHAGQALADLLRDERHQSRRPDAVVLALPRGGVPVAAEVARALDVELDVIVVRKIGVPGHEELAMGAIASGEVEVRQRVADRRARDQRAAVRGGTPTRPGRTGRAREELGRLGIPPSVRGRAVIVVDDGVATGATMQAARRGAPSTRPAHDHRCAPGRSARHRGRTRAHRRSRGVRAPARPVRGRRLLVRRLHPDFRRRGSPAAGTGPRPHVARRRVTPPKTAGRPD